MLEEKTYTTQVGEHEITFATGRFAEQAGGAVTIRMGDSLLLATATMSSGVREGLSFFPLTVDFEEKVYAVGRIPGGWFRREGRPTTESILICRVTDRAIRPLFPNGMRNEVQVINTPLSSDNVHHLDLMALNATSAALHISDAPWNGPVAGVRIGYLDGQFVVNPTVEQTEESKLDLRVSGTRTAFNMVEAGANEVSESMLVEALEYAQEQMQPLLEVFEQMRAEIGKPKREIEYLSSDEELEAKITERAAERVRAIVVQHTDRHEMNDALRALREQLNEEVVAEDEDIDLSAVNEVVENLTKKVVRKRIIEDGVRPDGRDYSSIRSLSSSVGISPRAHGSGLFQRGETQVLSVATLGTPRDAQKLDSLHPIESRRFMHHYNFPPYSTGETWFLRGPKRREIGHGMLGLTALTPVIPAEEDFPYTIRIVSEVMSSNGSTSQASICASTLALMDCGVPIKAPVAGISMGLVKEGDKYAVLTDIQGMEDHLGDMDFKVAGTREGVTALQMDIKVSGLSSEVLSQALEQARQARIQILDSMAETMAEPRESLNKWAPRMESIKIDPEAIGAVIGKGGSTVRAIQEEFEVSVDVQEDGTIFVAGVDGVTTDAALERIKRIAKGPELGDVILGKVVRITDFGAFVELVPGTDGLVHISQLSTDRVNKVEDVVELNDELLVMVTDKSRDGKVRLSRMAVLAGMSLEEARDADPAIGGSRGRGGNNRRRR